VTIIKEQEGKFSDFLAEKDSLKDSLHQQEIKNLLLEQSNKNLQDRIRGLEEERRMLENRLRGREIEAQEVAKTLRQYKTKLHKINDKVLWS